MKTYNLLNRKVATALIGKLFKLVDVEIRKENLKIEIRKRFGEKIPLGPQKENLDQVKVPPPPQIHNVTADEKV